MRYLTANYVFPVSAPPIKNGTIVIDDEGKILDLIQSDIPVPETEQYEGFICPGFVNAHCHLELSYMKGMISEKKGLSGFIEEFLQNRNESDQQEKTHIIHAENEMIKNGIVAVGDISNTSLTSAEKAKNKLYYHTFIELFDLEPSKAKQIFENGKNLSSKFLNQKSVLTPHAPYSVSVELMKMISEHAASNHTIISIHNQETQSENELFERRSGKLFDLFKKLNINLDHLPLTGKSSLPSYLQLLPCTNKILLVHNTFTKKDDIQFAQSYSNNIYWCFCPNANLYIENKLPEFLLFINEKAKCCIGTDSYASNWELSILAELKIISKYNPEISLQTLLQWATMNGAEFFGIANHYGSIEKNKRPGLNLIENVDLKNLRLTEKSIVKKII